MKGIKTYIIGIIMVIAGIAICFFPIPTHVLLGGTAALLGTGLIALRLGVRGVAMTLVDSIAEIKESVKATDIAGAYKIYIDRPKEKNG